MTDRERNERGRGRFGWPMARTTRGWATRATRSTSVPSGITRRSEHECGLVLRRANAGAVWTLRRTAGGTAAPALHVVDRPEYRWRGMHLDVSRHFFPVAGGRALHRPGRALQAQHVPLAPDRRPGLAAGDRPLSAPDERRRLPGRLAGRRPGGSSRTDGRPVCGWYTQDQVREVVAYAARRHVTIVPEIEMPGPRGRGARGLPAVRLRARPVRDAPALGHLDARSSARPSRPSASSTTCWARSRRCSPARTCTSAATRCPRTVWRHQPASWRR